MNCRSLVFLAKIRLVSQQTDCWARIVWRVKGLSCAFVFQGALSDQLAIHSAFRTQRAIGQFVPFMHATLAYGFRSSIQANAFWHQSIGMHACGGSCMAHQAIEAVMFAFPRRGKLSVQQGTSIRVSHEEKRVRHRSRAVEHRLSGVHTSFRRKASNTSRGNISLRPRVGDQS